MVGSTIIRQYPNVAVPETLFVTRNSDSARIPAESPETGILKRLFDFVMKNNNLYIHSIPGMVTDLIKKCIVCAVIVLLYTTVSGQNKTIDSLSQLVRSSPNDSLKSLALIELASNYNGYDTVKCGQALQQAFFIIKDQKNWDYNRAYYYQTKSDIVSTLGEFGQSLLLADSAILFYQKCEQTGNGLTKKNAGFQKAVVIAGKGSTYITMGNNENAIKFFLEGLRLYELSDHPEKFKAMATCYNNIATLYYSQHQYEKSMEYDVKAIPYHLLYGDKETISFAYIFVASDFSMLKQFDSSRAYFLKAEPYVKALDKPSVNIEYYGKTGGLYWTEKNWAKAIEYYMIAYANAQKINNLFGQAAYLRGIADSHYFSGNQQKAEIFALKAMAIDDQNDYTREKRELYNLLSMIYFKKQDYKNAYIYTKKYISENIKINDQEHKKIVADLDKKYLTAQKEKEITQLQKDKQIQALSIKQKSTLNYFLFGAVAALLLLGFLAYRNFRNGQQLAAQQGELQQQRIRELEKDKQLVAVDAMLKGQEEERSRLARDLHDGLGGLLSGVKFSLINMKDNLIITSDNMAVFERSLDMIDGSIKELRRVAHNMMPEMLIKFGLDEALKEYCNNINSTKLLTVKYQSLGMETRLENSVEIIIYRIVQELLNNTIKHAAATTSFVQLIREGDRLNIVVEDNGKGFDGSKTASNDGAGLQNVRSRVDYLKGQLAIHAEPGKGTLVNIELNIPL
jgi:two-component system NarL family sensor kinase